MRLTLNGVTTTVATDRAARLDPRFQELASVSPDGKTALYVTADGLGMANATFTALNLVARSQRVIAKLGNSFWPRQPLWSPDSSQILYARVTPQTFAPQLWVMRATGAQQQLVVAGGALTHRSLEGFAVSAPQWSANGQSIVFYDSAFKPTTRWTILLRTGARTSMPVAMAPSMCPTAATRSGVSPMVCSGGMCAVPVYYQNQQYFSNDVMQSAGETIGSAGCA